jgi:hypothetical protein
MRKGIVFLATGVFCLWLGDGPVSGQRPTGAEGKIEQELIALDKRLAEAEGKGDRKAVDQILASDYSLVDQTGRVVTRAQALTVMDRGHKATMTTSDYNVRVFEDVAVMTHAAVIKSGDHAENLRTTHVWVRRDGRWQLAADQCTSVAFPQIPSDKPFLNAACSEASFAPEVHQFYGTHRSIQQKLDGAEMGLDSRRVYLLLLESDNSASLTVFDRPSAEHQTVSISQWQGRTASDLREQLTNAILENRGVACIGEQAKRVVLARYSPRPIARISAPVTARAAFSHLLNTAAGEYVRATVFLLC